MASLRASVACVGLVVLFFTGVAEAIEVLVGGEDGSWKIPSSPLEAPNRWAYKLRLTINDTLVFKYDGKVDSVLEVSRHDYRDCETSEPIKAHSSGLTKVKLPKSGHYYFISGAPGHCQKGQKLLAIARKHGRGKFATPPSPNAPTPSPDAATAPSPNDAPTAAPPSEGAASPPPNYGGRVPAAAPSLPDVPEAAPSPYDDDDAVPAAAPSPYDEEISSAPSPAPNAGSPEEDIDISAPPSADKVPIAAPSPYDDDDDLDISGVPSAAPSPSGIDALETEVDDIL